MRKSINRLHLRRLAFRNKRPLAALNTAPRRRRLDVAASDRWEHVPDA